jgi:hypothetical protein
MPRHVHRPTRKVNWACPELLHRVSALVRPLTFRKPLRAAIARRAQPGAPRGKVRLSLTPHLDQEKAERLSCLAARAIREEKNLEVVVAAILEALSHSWRPIACAVP